MRESTMKAAAATILAIAWLLACPALALAQGAPARLVPFQARLTGANDAPLDGNFGVTFRIYETPTGGNPCWEETYPHQPPDRPGVPIIAGQMNVLLGSITPLDDPNKDTNPNDAISFNPTGATTCDPLDPPPNPGHCRCQAPGARFLGITVATGQGGSGQEMVPRHQLVPSFHARRADVADAVREGGVTDVMLADNAVIPSKLADGAVTTAKIADGAISGPKLAATVEVQGYVDGSIKGVDLRPQPATPGAACEAITGDKVCDGSLTDADLAPLPAVRLTHSAAVAYPRSTQTAMPFDQELYDPMSQDLHCVLNERPTDQNCTQQPLSRTRIPRTGVYAIHAYMQALTETCGKVVRTRVHRGGQVIQVGDRRHDSGDGFYWSFSFISPLQAGDLLEMTFAPGDSCPATVTVNQVEFSLALLR